MTHWTDLRLRRIHQRLEALEAALAQQAEPVEPVAWADKISFENAMKTGKGHDVWPKAGDYETRTGRALIGLYTAPPQRKPLLLECIDIVALHGGSVEIEAAIRAKMGETK